MTLDKVKELVSSNFDVIHTFRFKGTRNQIEEFNGRIVEMYPAIFIIKLDDSQLKSFSYSDLLVNNLIILD